MESFYCSHCKNPCDVYEVPVHIADEFGTQIHPPELLSQCCGADVVTERAIETELLNKHVHPVMRGILNGLFKAA